MSRARTRRVGTAVVMPLYNERGLVGPTIRGLPERVDTIVVVNDASTDGSRGEVVRLGDRRVVLLDVPERSGPGRALAIGLRWAARNGARHVVTMDADGQMDVRDLPRLLAPLDRGEADYVKGTRFHPSVSLAAMPLVRRVANRLLSRLAAWVLEDADLEDAHCGYTAASGTLLRRLDLDALHSGYGVYVDLLARVREVSGARIAYVPVAALYGSERSHVRWWPALTGYLRMMARLRWSHLAAMRAGAVTTRLRTGDARVAPDAPAD